MKWTQPCYDRLHHAGFQNKFPVVSSILQHFVDANDGGAPAARLGRQMQRGNSVAPIGTFMDENEESLQGKDIIVGHPPNEEHKDRSSQIGLLMALFPASS